MSDTLALVGRVPRLVPSSRGARELEGRSVSVTRVQELVRRAALVEGGVLLVAEHGADVESVARELHERRGLVQPLVQVDCGEGDAARLDRLLFGEVPPEASSLEVVSADSRLAAAIDSTLFLRDVAAIPAAVQAKLSRVVRDGEVSIDGKPVATNARFVAHATPGIDGEVQAHRFRGDLYRRLATWRIDLPPLRDRAEDVPFLVMRLVTDLCEARSLRPRTFTQAALALLGALTWPGNLGELADVVERVVSGSAQDTIQIEDLLPALQLERAPGRFVPSGNLREARLRFERDYIASVLQHHGWRMADAAQTLGIQRPNLYRKARQLGIPLARVLD